MCIYGALDSPKVGSRSNIICVGIFTKIVFKYVFVNNDINNGLGQAYTDICMLWDIY